MLMRNGTIFGLENELVEAFVNFGTDSSNTEKMQRWVILRDNENFKMKMKKLEITLPNEGVPNHHKSRLYHIAQYNSGKDPPGIYSTANHKLLFKDIENAILEVIQEDKNIDKLMVHAYGESYADNITKMRKDFALGRVRDLIFFFKFYSYLQR